MHSIPENARDIHVSINGITLHGTLQKPDQAKGVVLFTHGVSGSRFSPINRFVAKQLAGVRIATLLIDLLTPGERAYSKQRDINANITLLGSRLLHTYKWVKSEPAINQLPLGIFGNNNISAAATLSTASESGASVDALVLCHTRPELIKDYLPLVQAPILLIAGDKNHGQLQKSQDVMQRLGSIHRVEVVHGSAHAAHEFHSEPILRQIAEYTCDWFTERFAPVITPIN